MYETMYFITRKKFFNGAYTLQAVVSCIFILKLVFDEHLKVWDKNINDVVELVLTVLNMPLYKLDGPLHYLAWGVSTALLVVLVATGAFISYGLAHSSLDQMWVVSLFRGLLGFGLMFYFMPLQAWLAWVRCDYYDGILEGKSDFLRNLEIRDDQTESNMICFDSAQTHVLVLSILSIFLSILWFGLVMAGSLVHVNDPRSWSTLARPHCWCEIMDYSTGTFLLLISTFLAEFPIVLALSMFILRGFLAFFTIKLQPYYNEFMTDFKSALYVGQTYVALVFVIAASMDPSAGITVAALAGFPFLGAAGWFASSKYRQVVLKKALAEYQTEIEESESIGRNQNAGRGDSSAVLMGGQSKKDGQQAELTAVLQLGETNETLKENVWEVLDQEYVPGVTMSIWAWFAAVHVEVSTRFLQKDKCRLMPPELYLNIAENIYLKNLPTCGQSSYLALQYVTFITAYRENSGMAGKCLEDRIAHRMKINLGLGFSIFRKRKDIDRLKRSMDEDNGGDADAIGYEEIARMQQEASLAHLRCEMEIENVWQHLHNESLRLADKGGDVRTKTEIRLQRTQLLEKVVAAENRAEDAYIYVLERCKEAVKVFRDYARFLDTIKGDRHTAKLMVQRAEELDKTAKNDEAKSQGSESRKSDKDQDNSLLLRRQKKLAQVGWLKIKLRLASFLLFGSISALFVDYVVSILGYELTLLNLNESGSRRFYCQYAAMDVREMLIDANLNRSAAFEYAKKHIRYEMDFFLEMHINLAHEHRSTYEDLQLFYSSPIAEQVVNVPNPKTHSWTNRWRPMAVSGTDAPFRVIAEAYLAATMPMRHFNAYDKEKPSSAPEVAFLLENVNMVARGLDDATALYQMEAAYVAEKMRGIFIVLSALSGVIEIVLVVFIFRRAVVDAFAKLAVDVLQLGDSQHVPMAAVEHKIKMLKDAKTKSNQNATKNRGKKSAGADSESDSELGSDNGDTDQHDQQHNQARAMADDDEHQVTSVTRQQLVMSAFYYLCMIFLCACLTALCALCIIVVNNAERSAAEINNGSRRRWLGMRLKYFSSELIWNGPDFLSSAITGGAIRWLDTVQTIQCLLSRSAEAMLSVHYGMIYGEHQGFVGLPAERGFSQGGVKEWGPKGSTDMCSPFTWNQDHFRKSINTKGSIARYRPLDQTYFEKNCLTYLDPEVIPAGSFVMANERMQFFSDNFKGGLDKCDMYNAKCRRLSQAQYDALPESKCKYYKADGSCDEYDYSYYGKYRRINPVSHFLNRVVETNQDPCPQKPYPNSCYTRADAEDPACTCDDGSMRDEDCPDQVGTQGLHNFVLYLAEHSLTLGTKRFDELGAHNEEYEIIRSYDNIEWELGNLKAILLHQHEAISDMHTNTTITEIVYAFLVCVIFAQYFFLGKRIENLMIKHDHVSSIVKRLKKEASEISDKLKKTGEAKKAGLNNGAAEQYSDEDMSGEESPVSDEESIDAKA